MKNRLTAFGIIFVLWILALNTWAATVSGWVYQEDNQPLEDAIVTLMPCCGTPGYLYDDMETDSTGAFSFQTEAGSFWLRASHPEVNWQGIFYPNADSPEDATILELESDTIMDSLIMVLPPFQWPGSGHCVVTGQVTNENNNLPIEAVSIHLRPTNHGGGWWNHFWGETDIDGTYIIEDVAPGEYYAETRSWGWMGYYPEYYNDADDYEDADIIVITEEDSLITGINFTLESWWEEEGDNTVSGIVRDENQNPVWGATVTLTPCSPHGGPGNPLWNEYSYVEMTEEDGEYELDDIMDGHYILSVFSPLHNDYYYPDGGSIETAQPIHLENHADLGIDVLLQSRTLYHVSGMVFDSLAMQPLDNAQIIALKANSETGWFNETQANENYVVETDDTGVFSMDIPAGEYWFFAYHENYRGEFYLDAHSPYDAELVSIADDTDDIDFSLLAYNTENTNSIAGTIFENGSVPTYRVIIIAVSSEEDDWEDAVEMAGNGDYVLPYLPQEEYYVLAISASAPPTYYLDVQNWEDSEPILAAGTVDNVDIHLNRAETTGLLSLQGRIENETGQPVPNSTVFCRDQYGNVVAYAASNREGIYALNNLMATSYEVVATQPYHETYATSVDLEENSSLDIVWGTTPTSSVALPQTDAINQLVNYPNPFNPETRIAFTVSQSGPTELAIYNVRGQKVKTLVHREMSVGSHQVIWNGTNQAEEEVGSGLYFLRLKTAHNSIARKILLLK